MTTLPVAAIPHLADLDLVLRTPRLVLRPLDVTDVDGLWPYVSNPELPRYMTWSAHRDRSETRAFVEMRVRGMAEDRNAAWVVEQDGAVAGLVGLDEILRDVGARRFDRCEIGWWVAPPLWGRGICTEAARAIVDFAFGPLGMHKVTVGCVEENLASRRVIEKLGFRFLSVRKDHCFRDDRWWDDRDYELTVDEWRASKSA